MAAAKPCRTQLTPLSVCPPLGVPPVNLLPQNFAGLNLGSPPPSATPIIRPPANALGMGGGGVNPMGATTIPVNVSQGVMGMNMSMNMGMAAPVVMGGMAGMGMPASMGMPAAMSLATHPVGIAPSSAMVPPKQDAFATFGNFGK